MKSIHDHKSVKNTAAWALVAAGDHVGNLIGSKSPNGWTVSVHIWRGALAGARRQASVTSGDGYCKFSSAFAAAMAPDAPETDATGSAAVVDWFRTRGMEVLKVLD